MVLKKKIGAKRIVFVYAFTTAALLLLLFASVNIGSIKVTPMQMLKGLFVAYDEQVATIYHLRFPRIFIAMAGGAAVAVSGVLLQAVMKNPLADPGILGISSGASLASVLITMFFPAMFFSIPVFAFFGGIAACALVYVLSWKGGLHPLRVILTGVAVNAFFTGLLSAGNSMLGKDYTGAASIIDGNISMKTWDDFKMLIFYTVIGLVLSLVLAKYCDILGLEDKTILSLGIHVNAAISLLTSNPLISLIYYK